MKEKTPKSMRTQIGIFGRTNVGKSSFLNMIAAQDVSIVSSAPGTTTDVVEKAMEFRPVGPVVFLDTAGLDDVSGLSAERLRRTAAVFERADIFVVVTEEGAWGAHEEHVRQIALSKDVPLIAVVNKTDFRPLTDDFHRRLLKITPHVVPFCSLGGAVRNVSAFRAILSACTQESAEQPEPQTIVCDLIPKNSLALLVTPIDSGAPRGRLILPQAQVIRDLLDGGCATMIVRDSEFLMAPIMLNRRPNIVICDSQIVQKIAPLTPIDIPLTTFSILFARLKGDLEELVRGASAIAGLKNGGAVLIAEACAHHAAHDDIGRVKIPRLLREYFGANLRIDISSGKDYPENLTQYSLIIYCGACMLTKKEMASRIKSAISKNVPITNYGLALSYFSGVFERVIEPFNIGPQEQRLERTI